MSDDRNKTGAAFRATVVVVVGLLLYVLSFGPACWAVGRGKLGARPAAVIYRPLAVLTWKGPGWISGPLYRLANMTDVGGADGLGEIQDAAGYCDVLGGSRVYRVPDK